MLRNLSEKKNAGKFPATTLSYSMVKIACNKDAFSENLWTGSKPSRRSITAAGILEKEKKERQKKKTSKVSFLRMSKKKCASGRRRHAAMLQMPFRVDWSYFGPFPGQNVQKMRF